MLPVACPFLHPFLTPGFFASLTLWSSLTDYTHRSELSEPVRLVLILNKE